MTTIEPRIRAGEISAPEVFTGGTPCQAFSVAGKRGSLSDDRGNLSLTFCEIANAVDDVRSARGEESAIIVWENVPGVLSTSDNAFGCFLAGLAGDDQPIEPGPRPEPGRSSAHWTWKKDTGQHCAKWPDAGVVTGPSRAVAWRVLDAQYFGLAQRRQRVFVVASARNGFDPGAVLFEFDGLRRDSPPSREAGQGAAAGAGSGAEGGSWWDGGQVSQTLDAVLYKGQTMPEKNRFPAVLTPAIVVHGTQDPCVITSTAFALGRNNGGENAVLSVALRGREGGGTAELGDDVAGCLRASSGGGDKPHVLAPSVCVTGDITHTLKAEGFDGSEDGTGRGQPIVALALGRNNGGENAVCQYGHVAGSLTARHDSSPCADRGQSVVATAMRVRRLTPVECERLQGFNDNHTMVPHRGKPAADGPRYKAIGNSWAVTCARWIGFRIQMQLKAANDNNQ